MGGHAVMMTSSSVNILIHDSFSVFEFHTVVSCTGLVVYITIVR